MLYESADGVWIHELLTKTLKPGGAAFFADPQREGVGTFVEQLAASRFHVQVHHRDTEWMAGREEVDVYEIQSG